MFKVAEKILQFTKKNKIILIILILSFVIRLYRLDQPSTYVFDEYFHAYTSKLYINNPELAWNWSYPMIAPDKSGGNSWDHPPVAKEIMASFMILFQNQNPLIYRLPGLILGVISIYLVYLLGKNIFKNESVARVSAYLFSIDGLNFILSRTGMLDIYLLTFILFSLNFFVRKRLFYSAIFLGLALATKWSAVFLIIFYLAYLLLIKNIFKDISKVGVFILISAFVYFLTFIPFFAVGHDLSELFYYHRDIWVNQINSNYLNGYPPSDWWTWLFNLTPVQFASNPLINSGYVQVIYTLTNPFLLLGFFFSIFYICYLWLKDKLNDKNIFIPIIGIACFFLPWAFVNRNTYLYYLNLSIPFMCLMVAYCLNKINRKVLWVVLAIPLLVFILYYPLLSYLPISVKLLQFLIF